jgi:hypothetical protein
MDTFDSIVESVVEGLEVARKGNGHVEFRFPSEEAPTSPSAAGSRAPRSTMIAASRKARKAMKLEMKAVLRAELIRFRIYDYENVFNTQRNAPDQQSYLTNQNQAKGFDIQFVEPYTCDSGVCVNAVMRIRSALDAVQCFIQHEGAPDSRGISFWTHLGEESLDFIRFVIGKLAIAANINYEDYMRHEDHFTEQMRGELEEHRQRILLLERQLRQHTAGDSDGSTSDSF